MEVINRPAIAGRNLRSGVFELLQWGRNTGALKVPAQASGFMVESPDEKPDVPVGGQEGERFCSSCRQAQLN